MNAIAKFPISSGSGKTKILIPKGTQGFIKGVSNSPAIKALFPNLEHKLDGYYYIVKFVGFEDILVSKEQILINEKLNDSPHT